MSSGSGRLQVTLLSNITAWLWKEPNTHFSLSEGPNLGRAGTVISTWEEKKERVERKTKLEK